MKSAPLALSSANTAMVCLFCGKLFRYRSMTLSVDFKIILLKIIVTVTVFRRFFLR